jgi:hypothetical protein
MGALNKGMTAIIIMRRKASAYNSLKGRLMLRLGGQEPKPTSIAIGNEQRREK